jgi:MoxR-like ATPase
MMGAAPEAGSPIRAAIRFSSPDEVRERLDGVGYLIDHSAATTVYLAGELIKPVLVEGPAGTGKTELAKSVAAMAGARLIRLQCYEGLDEAKALYEWNYKKQLLRIQSERNMSSSSGDTMRSTLDDAIFTPEFLLERPLLAAIRSEEPIVLLIDEVDRIDVEAEALLLEILSDYQVSVPELGTIVARRAPLVFLTSNGSRDLSEALRRRCLFLYLGYPDLEREREIVERKVPGIDAQLRDRLTLTVRSLRGLDLKKRPSVSETLDWARTLMLLGADKLDAGMVRDTLHILLKNQSDIEKAGLALAETLEQAEI